MTDSVFEHADVERLLDVAIEEDLREEGDVTSRVIPADATCRAQVIYREGGVVCGLPLAVKVLARIVPEARFTANHADGDVVEPGTAVAELAGPARGVLAAERLLLNLLQRLGGVATATKRFVDAIHGTSAHVLDTRKTTPGWRLLEKYAVRTGGGVNHRFGLYDQVLLKDNHLALMGGETRIPDVIARAREAAPPGTPVEIEVTTCEGALEASRAGAEIVLLDNMDPPQLAVTVTKVRHDAHARGVEPPLLEASGGIDLDTIVGYAQTGVDRISSGWITHSSPALDVALDFLPPEA
ncbi:MAG: carboxylating nicotinate-nucleotide diphosphorylase [Planctomycetota bacterium]